VNSHTTAKFRRQLAALPREIRRQAQEAYQRFLHDPWHPGLRFKRVHSLKPVYAVRINRDYRALGILQDNDIVWFWIGSHADYDKILQQLKHH